MENEEQKKSLKVKIIISFLFLVVLIILFFLLSNKKELNMVTKVDKVVNYEQEETQVETVANIETVETVDKYRQEVPDNIVVPEVDTKLNEDQKEEIAIPSLVIPASSGSESSFRSFDIRAENGAFIPNKVIAKAGDVIRINFTAVDGNYDINFPSYSMRQQASAGQTKILEFQAVEAGSFIYYCQSCGGEDSSVKGNIIITK